MDKSHVQQAQEQSEQFQDTRKAPLRHILIIGAGLTGLTLAIGLRQSGYQVTVLERNPKLQDVGAGIQLPANSCRVLSALGVLEDAKSFSVWPQSLIIHSYRGRQLYDQPLNPVIERKYGFPHLLIHRADIRRILYDAAVEGGAIVKFGIDIQSVDVSNATAKSDTGSIFSADLIVGADGEHSTCRDSLLAKTDHLPRSSGDNVFRVGIPSKELEDSGLSDLVSTPCVRVWYGPDSHAVAYQLQKGGIFNIVLTLPEPKGAATIGPQPADLSYLRAECKNWDPRFRKLLDKATMALKWTLLESAELPQWNDHQGKVLLIGDSAHATLPYLAQGAAMALESAYLLSKMLANRPNLTEVPTLLSAFAKVRKARTQAIKDRSKAMHDICQLEDGPAQVERDRILLEEEPYEGFPNLWADPSWQELIWGYIPENDMLRMHKL